jgi:RNA polymerase sigma factor (sigma-70 family)
MVVGFADSEELLLADSAPSILEILTAADERNDLHLHVSQLPEPYRSAIRRKFFDGHSYEQIASSMGVPSKTVRSWAWRAFRKLRAKLELARET